jgi:hypothetical protein
MRNESGKSCNRVESFQGDDCCRRGAPILSVLSRGSLAHDLVLRVQRDSDQDEMVFMTRTVIMCVRDEGEDDLNGNQNFYWTR